MHFNMSYCSAILLWNLDWKCHLLPDIHCVLHDSHICLALGRRVDGQLSWRNDKAFAKWQPHAFSKSICESETKRRIFQPVLLHCETRKLPFGWHSFIILQKEFFSWGSLEVKLKFWVQEYKNSGVQGNNERHIFTLKKRQVIVHIWQMISA